MKDINERCPLQAECERKKCEFVKRELRCDYYSANARGELAIEDQEKLRREREEDPFSSEEGAFLAEEFGMSGQPPRPEPRDLEIITEEIVFYKRQAGSAILEIGSRLNEAKAQMEHGKWLDWLREKVDLSERSAQNFMRLAREYGKSAEIADLGASKALALLVLPDSERERFTAEKHDVDGVEKSVAEMSGEELKRAIRERDEAVEQEKRAREDAEAACAKLGAAERENAEKLREEQAGREELRAQLESLREKLEKAREQEKNAASEKAELEEQLRKLRDRPVEVAVEQPGEELLQKLRAEAEKAAEKRVREADNRLTEARSRAEAAERAEKEARRELSLSDAETMTFRIRFADWQASYQAMREAMEKIPDGEKRKKLRRAVTDAAERMGAL